MALIYLCAQLRKYDLYFQLADNPVSNFRAIIIDHRLREGSGKEAHAVADAVRKMGLPGDAWPIHWPKPGGVRGRWEHPKDLPNVESVARRLRYRKLAELCNYRASVSLLMAHHEDDQYETVLMRLLQGHGPRGLRGIKAAVDIPECEGLHGADRSGYVDDQKKSRPFYNRSLAKRGFTGLRRELASSIDPQMLEEELRETIVDGTDVGDFEELYQTEQTVSLDLSGIEVEDGGIMVYRPLLEFSKDRLIATCEANGIPWWEDSTNMDQTLTIRNAVRHMCKNHTLPVALQKPSILALSRRCAQETRAREAEADRLLAQTIIHSVEPKIGSVSVQFPDYSLSRFPRDKSHPVRRRARILRQREIAGVLIRRIIEIVTPQQQTIPLANLQNVISWLFPALSDPPKKQNMAEPPKAFGIAGVHFVPIDPESPSPSLSNQGIPSRKADEPLVWYFSRTPYPSNQPVPRYRAPYWSAMFSFRGFNKDHCKWSQWMQWALWDGRFWIRLRHRLPYRVILHPFELSHAKTFRESLAPEDRARLGALLKRYAPGKTRYTLPALYLEEDLDLLNVKPRRYYPISPAVLHMCYPTRARKGLTDPTSDHPTTLDVSKLKLIALPSLEVQIPHLDDWLQYEIRYRRVDRSTLETASSTNYSSFVSSRSLRTGPSAAVAAFLELRRALRRRKRRSVRGHRILSRRNGTK